MWAAVAVKLVALRHQRTDRRDRQTESQLVPCRAAVEVASLSSVSDDTVVVVAYDLPEAERRFAGEVERDFEVRRSSCCCCYSVMRSYQCCELAQKSLRH